MAVTDVEAVKFANERVRVAADKLAQAYYFAKLVRDEWFANDMASLFPGGGGIVVDGSASDGRHPVTAEQVTNLITRCDELLTDYQATSNAKLNTILQVSVNPQS